jgi:uncharacterized protein GlcG (DUF336 family)
VLSQEDSSGIVNAVLAAAKKESLNVCVCVVDGNGDLIALQKMDHASRVAMELCQAKAATAAIFGLPTNEIAPLAQPGQPLYGLLHMQGGRFTAFGGGFPVRRQGRVIGAVGIGGAEPGQDIWLARLGADIVTDHVTGG